MKYLTGLVAALASSSVLASGTTIRVGEDAVSLYLEPKPSPTNSAQFALVHNNDDDITLGSVGLFANGQRQQLSGRLGGKAYYADLDSDSGYGLALGGDFSFALNPDLSLDAGLYYGPDSLSFSDVEGYEEWYVKLNLKVFDNATLGAGYGSFDIEPEAGNRDVEIDDGVFFEMKLRL